MAAEESYFRRGLGMGDAVRARLEGDYHSDLVDRLRARGYRLDAGSPAGPTTVKLAHEFGFCYGVERAVNYAYQTRQKFPDRAIYITGEIIHNPGVNRRLRDMGIRFLDGADGATWRLEELGPEDVVILPAFGVPVGTMRQIAERGCVMVDSTCGSVLNVWKNVEKFAREGFTSVIHGKYAHEETAATASRATGAGGCYVVVRDLEEARRVCREIEGPADPEEFLTRFAPAISKGFDPAAHLARIGVANQTTMLSSESLEIAQLLRAAMVRRHGEEEAARRFRSFDTICSATQDRQDAVRRLLADGVDLMLVIGGYNSSNTNHLTRISSQVVPTYHIDGASALEDGGRIRHLPPGRTTEEIREGWLPLEGALTVGATAGASTPNSEVGRVLEMVLLLRGVTPQELASLLA